METFFGIAIGVIATVLVSHYYFKKSTSRKLSPYLIMSSNVFSGVDDQLRKSLKFFFNQSEIENLQQIELLIANSGEKAISHFIEPLTMTFPNKAQVLDASILFKHPADLEVNLEIFQSHNGDGIIKFTMPLLNKGDYFFLKCLINGKITPFDITFHTLAEDLPRSLGLEWLPPEATKKRKFEVEWAAVIVGLIVVIIAAAFGYGIFLLWTLRPDIFPFPWKSFHGSIINWCLTVLWAFGCIGLGIIGIILSLAIGLEQIFKRSPKFPIPDEFRSRGWFFDFPSPLIEQSDSSKSSKKSVADA